MRFGLFSGVLFLLACTSFSAARDLESIQMLPVQDNGRVKPLDTLARESVQLITGRARFGVVVEDAAGSQSISNVSDAVSVFLDWQANQGAWESRPVLYVPLLELRQKLGMPISHQWVAPARCRSTSFRTWIGQLASRRTQADATGENPAFTRLEVAAQELQHRLDLFDAVQNGECLAIVPVSGHGDRWLSLRELRILQGPDGDAVAPLLGHWDAALDAFRAGDDLKFHDETDQVIEQLDQLIGPDFHKYDAAIKREVLYNQWRPFLWCGGLYLLALLTAISSAMVARRALDMAATVLFMVAVLLNIAAIAFRCTITGWAPVTNIYETVVWVAMVGALIGLILRLIYGQRILVIGGSVVAIAGTIIADVMPPEFGGAIRNLTPVLRSNLWLSTHVLTIVSGYAAFALALVLGNVVLGQFMLKRTDRASITRNLVFVYRSVQIGVLLVATGTILGGLWADVSWGRFWGWDPKEVWALIVLLVYLALLHGRHSGWIGRFGLAAGSVICFTAVLMSWYGVNFVLGVGLHSYGFGTGGQVYIAAYVLAQWLFVVLAWMKYRTLQKADWAEPLPKALADPA
jgi:ABC-type transport system involved in cytochrome c biogenesis permease subunit